MRLWRASSGGARRGLGKGALGVGLVLAVQTACAAFFILDLASARVGFLSGPIPWELRELLEIGSALGLVLGIALGAFVLRRLVAERNAAHERLRRAASAFGDLMEERFAEWGLTPAERDVALFAIKGFSLADIARLRETSEGTVKAQTNAIYRKAGVSGRSQLLSLFIDELIGADNRLQAGGLSGVSGLSGAAPGGAPVAPVSASPGPQVPAGKS